MSVFVFLGPSLALEQARAILDATYLPPVAMGDLYRLVKSRARSGDQIAIIDGLFEQVPAVWHKEVLHALTRGIRVYGAASMGALRAAELHPFGMIGVGQIFEAYRDGELEDDDEVVVVHAPAERGFHPTSEAMVNIRLGLRQAAEQELISAETTASLQALAKNDFYAERSWERVYQGGLAAGIATAEIDALRHFVATERPNAKRDDAMALLRQLGTEPAPIHTNSAPSFTLEETTFWIGLTRAHAGELPARDQGASINGNDRNDISAAGTDVVPVAAVVDHVRATEPGRAELWRDALLLRLLTELGASLTITREQVQATTIGFCRRHGLGSRQALDDWRIEQALSKRELSYLLELETRAALMLERHRRKLDDYVLLELKRQGRYSEVAAVVAGKRKNLERLGISKPILEDAGIDAATLQKWYEQRCGPMHQSPEKHIESLGFESLRDFISELLSLYMLEQES